MMHTKLSQDAAPAPAAGTGGLRQYMPDLSGLRNYIPDVNAWWNSLPDFTAAGPQAKGRAAAAAAAAAAADAKLTEQNKRMMDAVALYALGGFGAGMSGTKLYNLISQANKPKDKYTKFGPGAKTVDDDEKIAADAAPPAPTMVQQISNSVRAVPDYLASRVPALPGMNDLSENQKAVFIPALLATTAASMYGGHALMHSILERKRKEDTKEMVEDAKKEYQRALTGKSAATLDAAFETYQKKVASNSPFGALGTAWDYLVEPLRYVPGALPVYTGVLGGTGLLAGKMTYDWTRERSKDKALERARKSRARIEDTSPIYVDPEQIVAIRNLVDKQKQKAKRPEPQQDTYSNY